MSGLLKLCVDLLLVLGGSKEAAAALRLASAFDDKDDAAVRAQLVIVLLDPREACGPGFSLAAALAVRVYIVYAPLVGCSRVQRRMTRAGLAALRVPEETFTPA